MEGSVAVSVQTIQATGVSESVRTGVVVTDLTIVESGKVAGAVSVWRVVGVGEISRTALTVWEGTTDDGFSSTHDQYTCVVILMISLSVQIKSVELVSKNHPSGRSLLLFISLSVLSLSGNGMMFNSV